MRELSSILFFLTGLSTMAQSWSPQGAAWAYHFDNGSQVDYRVEYWYSHDTLIDGLDAKVARAHAFGGTGGPPIDNLWWEYSRVEDDVVYQGDIQGNWDTLYWYGEIGDRWWPIGSPMTCPPWGMLEIVDTGHVMVGPISLRNWSVVYIDSLGESLNNPFTFVERMGTVPRSPEVWDCNMIIEYFFSSFICYSDSELVSLGAAPCEVAAGIPPIEAGSPTLHIAPNPAQGMVRVGVDRWEPGSELLIFDSGGSMKDRRQLLSSEIMLPLTGAAPGPYEIVVRAPSGRMLRSRIAVY